MKTILAFLCLGAISVQAQGTYQVRPAPFNNGVNVYAPNGALYQSIRPAPFNAGYNVYGRSGALESEIRPAPFNNGYNIHTMPRYGNYGY